MTQKTPSFSRLVPVSAETICTYAGLDVADHPKLSGSENPAALAATFCEADAQDLLVALLAFALPKREAIWWACLAARLEERCAGLQQPGNAVVLAETWIRDPSEDNRYPCFAAAEADNFGTSGAFAAIAAFWAGPTIGPRGSENVPPASHLVAVAVQSAIKLCHFSKRAKTPPSFRDILEIGIEIADGGSGRLAWTELTERNQVLP